MDRGASSKSHGGVGLVAVDLIGRIFGGARRRRSRHLGNSLCGLRGYNSLKDRNSHPHLGCGKTSIEKLEGMHDSSDEDEDKLRLLQLKRRRPSSSSDDGQSKRWASSTDQYCHRRRKGFYCMRLRIVNIVRIVAMIRKVRLAYQRMMRSAAASKTILSLADLYNDIADLIPVPCTGNNEARTIVVIRPITCAPGSSQDDEVEERAGLASGHGAGASSSARRGLSTARQPGADNNGMWTAGPAKSVTDHIPSSSWRKFIFPRFSCICASNMASWTSPC